MKNSQLLKELVKKINNEEIVLFLSTEHFNGKETSKIRIRISEKNSLNFYELGELNIEPEETSKEKLQDIYRMLQNASKGC